MIHTASFLFRKINKKHTLGRLTNRFIHYSKETTNTSKILTPGCLQFIEDIYNSNSSSYEEVIQLRKLNNKKKNFTFRDDTADIRESDWKASKLPDKSAPPLPGNKFPPIKAFALYKSKVGWNSTSN